MDDHVKQLLLLGREHYQKRELDKAEYLGALAEVGAAYRDVMGKSFPAMAVVVVKGLVEDEARLEIETTAVVPRSP